MWREKEDTPTLEFINPEEHFRQQYPYLAKLDDWHLREALLAIERNPTNIFLQYTDLLNMPEFDKISEIFTKVNYHLTILKSELSDPDIALQLSPVLLKFINHLEMEDLASHATAISSQMPVIDMAGSDFITFEHRKLELGAYYFINLTSRNDQIVGSNVRLRIIVTPTNELQIRIKKPEKTPDSMLSTALKRMGFAELGRLITTSVEGTAAAPDMVNKDSSEALITLQPDDNNAALVLTDLNTIVGAVTNKLSTKKASHLSSWNTPEVQTASLFQEDFIQHCIKRQGTTLESGVIEQLKRVIQKFAKEEAAEFSEQCGKEDGSAWAILQNFDLVYNSLVYIVSATMMLTVSSQIMSGAQLEKLSKIDLLSVAALLFLITNGAFQTVRKQKYSTDE